MSRALRRSLLGLAVLAGVALLLAVAWAIDTRRTDDRVLRRVTLAGRPIGNLSTPEVTAVVAAVATDLPGRPVEIRAPGGGFVTEAETFGLRVAEPATVRAALRVGRTGSAPARIWEWMQSFAKDRPAPVRIALDNSAVYAAVAEKDPDRRPPVEPSIDFKKGEFVIVEGRAGRGIDPLDVIKGLPSAAIKGEVMVVKVDRGKIEPRFPASVAEQLVADVEATLAKPLVVTADQAQATVPVATLKSWVRSAVRDDGLHPVTDSEAVLGDLRKLLAKAGEPATETRFAVEGGKVKVIAGTAGTQCCGDGAAARIQKALFDAPATGPVDLPMTDRPPKLTVEKASELNINEAVGTFTTKHAGGEPRVENIHRMADLIRGSVIQPGQSFSVNDTVGKRTAAKGFVEAPAIESGVLTTDIGGGVSQFATTLFNAAFFAGLDFGEYQSHSLRISRYPHGREATMGYPHPDLVIKNTTPHGVLIWPTYTGTTITVTLYSTRFAEGAQTGQSEAPSGACTRVTTERTRTYAADGRKEVDKVYAIYRPAEGVQC